MIDQVHPRTKSLIYFCRVAANVNVNFNELFLSPRESCNIVTTAAPSVLSSAVYKNERVSATVTSEMTVVSSNM